MVYHSYEKLVEIHNFSETLETALGRIHCHLKLSLFIREEKKEMKDIRNVELDETLVKVNKMAAIKPSLDRSKDTETLSLESKQREFKKK